MRSSESASVGRFFRHSRRPRARAAPFDGHRPLNASLYSRITRHEEFAMTRTETGSTTRLLERNTADRIGRAGAGSGAFGIRFGVDRRSLRLRRVDAARVGRREYDSDPPRHRHLPVVGAHADCDGDGGDDARPSFRRPYDPRPRRVRPTGRRRLVRRAVRQPLARTREYIDIVRQVLRARSSRSRMPGPHYPLPYDRRRRLGPRQATEVDRASAARRPADLHGRRRTEERRAGRGDRRRLVAVVLLAVSKGRVQRVAVEREAGFRNIPRRRRQHH